MGCAASLATLDVIKDERLVENSAKMGEYFRKRLAELQEKHEIIGDVRGLGLMIAVEFVRNRKTKEFAVKERDDIINGAFKRGLILLGCGKSGVRLIPSLNVTKEQIDTATEIIDSSISAVVD